MSGRADAGVNLKGQSARDEGVDVVAGMGLHGPVGMAVVLKRDAAGQDVLLLVFPAVAALVGGYAVGYGAVGGLLQVEVEGGLDFEAGFVDLLGAEALFEFAADFFLEPGGNGALRLRDVEAERGLTRLFSLRVVMSPSTPFQRGRGCGGGELFQGSEAEKMRRDLWAGRRAERPQSG